MRHIGPAAAMFGKFNKLWKTKNTSQMTKIILYETCVTAVMLMYESECLSLLKDYEMKKNY